jgi:ferric-dicitrate binding protein FerR (iron transport regulator)
VTTQGAPAAPASADLTTALDWTGLFIFRTTPLSVVADRMSRHYDAEVTVADALADEPVTGTFERGQPVQEVLEALAATLGAEVQRTDGAYRLVPGS